MRQSKAERLRVRTIRALAAHHRINPMVEDCWIYGGFSVYEVSGDLLDILTARSAGLTPRKARSRPAKERQAG